MAITSPALSISIEAMFGAIRPSMNALKKLGATDFSAAAPGVDVKPGTTVKIPISSVTAASAYNAASNNYTTGGPTTWASLAATHYLQGFDVSGVDLDSGVNAGRIKQLFAVRAGKGIAAACAAAVKAALDSCTQSTGVTLTAINASASPATEPSLSEYLTLGSGVTWLDRENAVLAVNGACYANIKKVFAAGNIVFASNTEMAQYMGYRDLVLIPGMTARACIVPDGTLGLLGRVPAILANYPEAGAETDEDSGLSVGIVVADDQSQNRQIVNADLWFGVATLSASANNTTTQGIIKLA